MTTFTRHKMCLDLTGFRGEAAMPMSYRVETLAPADLDALSVLELEGYRGTPDWDLVPELQTLEGCRTFVDDLLSGRTMFSGKQGTFRPDLSFKLVTGDTPAGAIYSLFTSDEAFIIDFVLGSGSQGSRTRHTVPHVLACALPGRGLSPGVSVCDGHQLQCPPYIREDGFSGSGYIHHRPRDRLVEGRLNDARRLRRTTANP
jgi:hypothetical protein